MKPSAGRASAFLVPLLPKPLDQFPSLSLADLHQFGAQLLAALPLIDRGVSFPGEISAEGFVETTLGRRGAPSKPGRSVRSVAVAEDRVIQDVLCHAPTYCSFLYAFISSAPYGTRTS